MFPKNIGHLVSHRILFILALNDCYYLYIYQDLTILEPVYSGAYLELCSARAGLYASDRHCFSAFVLFIEGKMWWLNHTGVNPSLVRTINGRRLQQGYRVTAQASSKSNMLAGKPQAL